jgi:hypothetical protein
MKIEAEIRARLEAMKGKQYRYINKNYLVKDVTIDEEAGMVSIKTDKENFSRKVESVETLLTYWKRIPSGEKDNNTMSVVEDSNELPEITQTNTLANDLVDILKDSIKKVQENPAYIQQAASINANVSSILEVQKVKIGIVKQLRKLKKSMKVE